MLIVCIKKSLNWCDQTNHWLRHRLVFDNTNSFLRMFIELTQFYYHTCNKNIPLIITILKSYKTVALRDVQDLNPKKEITVLKGPTN